MRFKSSTSTSQGKESLLSHRCVLRCYEFCCIRENVKVQSELLRHSNIGTTLDLYAQAVSDQKRAAHGQAVGQLLAV